MNLQEILDEWDKDSAVDILSLESLQAEVHKLHAKYLRYYTTEKMVLKHLESQFKVLKFKKYEFYTQGPNEETKSWRLPAQGKILKAEVNIFLEADEDLIKLQLKIDLANEKVKSLESIIDMVKYRTNMISSLMNFQKFIAGA